MEHEFERSYDPEVAAAAAYSPEQFTVFLFRGMKNLASSADFSPKQVHRGCESERNLLPTRLFSNP